MRKLVALGAGVALCIAGWTIASADGPHATSGFDGVHQDDSHQWNPAHLWVLFGAPGPGHIMSGGRFHTNCDWSLLECTGAFRDTDWALDIGHVEDFDSRLYLGYGGWGAGGLTPDNDLPIVLAARVVGAGNLREHLQGVFPACDWQQYAVLASFWDTAGNYHREQPIGALWYSHLTNWSYGLGDYVPPDTVLSNPYGSGVVHTISGQKMGEVFRGGDAISSAFGHGSCSQGDHTHIEGYSSHSWGFLYEWHSESGPDGYSGLAGVPPEIATFYSTPFDRVTAGQNLGALGGNTTSFWMRANPFRPEY
ncbi:MAG TPA: hypothetical protein VFK32_01725 [Tepidiformaceae bacterium]|nr:hypothetical protein [Tepidiformaceae bacterium]